ncbi:MAG: cytochrome c [Gammaproteobacteria bacterium]|nr:cytochrome c [Gammaproteobacteria bacterium]
MNAASSTRRAWLVAGAVVVAVGAIAAWLLLPPRALSFAGSHTVSLGDYKGASPTGAPAELGSADVIARGRYLTQAADCQVCHTRAGGQLFAGGLAFETPFGVLYSPNITADRETGIGAWSDAEFLRAVHQGIARDGERLYPAFPYESYTLIADEDVLAIKAYLFSLPVAHAVAPPNSLRFPFNQRWLMGIWAAFYNPDRRFQPLDDRSAEWNRGAYLAEALAHCGDCHTPRNLAQALDNRRKFAGALVSGWRAYNITSDPVSGVGSWSEDDLAQYLQSGHATGHGSAGGPMAEEIAAASSRLTPGDLHAIAVYLRTIPGIRTRDLPAVKAEAASDSARPIQGADDSRGREIFAGACASCHGWSGVSLTTHYATLTGDRAVNDVTAANVVQTVLSGASTRMPEGLVFMPAFGDAYSDTEVAAVANYVTARFGAAPSRLTAEDVARLRRLSSP